MSLRDDIVANARWGAANEPDIHYTQAASRMDAVHTPRQLPLYTDCSGFVTFCYSWAGAPDPNGRGYNGTGYTGTLLANLEHIDADQLRPADLIVFGPGGGDHVVIAIEDGPDPMTVSHGQEKGPIEIRLSVEARAHRAPVTCLRGAGLDDPQPPIPQEDAMDAQQSLAAIEMLTDIQKKVDDLEARALTPEQLDALVGEKDGLYAALNDRFAQLEAAVAKIVAKVGA